MVVACQYCLKEANHYSGTEIEQLSGVVGSWQEVYLLHFPSYLQLVCYGENERIHGPKLVLTIKVDLV